MTADAQTQYKQLLRRLSLAVRFGDEQEDLHTLCTELLQWMQEQGEPVAKYALLERKYQLLHSTLQMISQSQGTAAQSAERSLLKVQQMNDSKEPMQQLRSYVAPTSYPESRESQKLKKVVNKALASLEQMEDLLRRDDLAAELFRALSEGDPNNLRITLEQILNPSISKPAPTSYV